MVNNLILPVMSYDISEAVIPSPTASSGRYSPSPVYIVIVIVAPAEELYASVWLVVVSFSGILLSIGVVSDTADADDPASIITSNTRVIKRISFFTSTTSWVNYRFKHL